MIIASAGGWALRPGAAPSGRWAGRPLPSRPPACYFRPGGSFEVVALLPLVFVLEDVRPGGLLVVDDERLFRDRRAVADHVVDHRVVVAAHGQLATDTERRVDGLSGDRLRQLVGVGVAAGLLQAFDDEVNAGRGFTAPVGRLHLGRSE